MREIDEEKQTAQDFADLEEDQRNCEITEDDQTGPKRTRRKCKAPDRYGLPVYICGVTKTKQKETQKTFVSNPFNCDDLLIYFANSYIYVLLRD